MLMTGIVFVNRNSFMITSARKLKFVTVDHIPSRKTEKLIISLNKGIKLYRRGSFIILVILVDTEFENVADILGNIEVNISVSR